LKDLRDQVRHQPVALRIPGYPTFTLVQAYAVNPVTHGLNLPNNATTVAWWSSGSMPGDVTGTVVLAAHVSYNGRRGPFTHLDRLAPGAIVSVRQADGTVRNFRVAGERVVDKASLKREDLFRTTGAPRLALITCGGTYNAATRNYSENVIIFAVPTS
jgi:LPXTG-site transpeptidase (sortase) family protein